MLTTVETYSKVTSDVDVAAVRINMFALYMYIYTQYCWIYIRVVGNQRVRGHF